MPFGPPATASDAAGWRAEDGRCLAREPQHDGAAVRDSVELVLQAGVPARSHVANRLLRLTGATRSLPEAAPREAVALSKEPKADVGHYDGPQVRAEESRNAS